MHATLLLLWAAGRMRASAGISLPLLDASGPAFTVFLVWTKGRKIFLIASEDSACLELSAIVFGVAYSQIRLHHQTSLSSLKRISGSGL